MTKRPSSRLNHAMVPVVSLLLFVAGAASSAGADETNEPAGVTPQEVDELIAKVKPDDPFPPPETLKDVRGAALLVAALKKDPRGPWLHFLNLAFAENQRTARSLDRAERKDAFAGLLVQLKEARRLMELDTTPQDELTPSSMLRLEENINVASIEAGVDFDQAKLSAKAMLFGNADEKSWQYGNVIFNAHTILGRVALREGRVDDAKQHLLESGKTPGSPQLNSFGPDFILAGELVEAGERPAVIEFLDLVAKFWATPQKLDEKVRSYREQKARNREQLEKWKQEILNGKIPQSGQDPTQGWPGGNLDAEREVERSPELLVLERFAGTWDIKITVDRKGQPAQTIDVVSTRKWSRVGGVLVVEDSYEDELHMSLKFDATLNAYFGVMMSAGSRGFVTAKWDDATSTLSVVVENLDRSFYRFTHRFVREGYAEASGFITDSKGNVVMRLKSEMTRRK